MRGWFYDRYKHGLAAKGIKTRLPYEKNWQFGLRSPPKVRKSEARMSFASVDFSDDDSYKDFKKAYLDAKDSGQKSFIYNDQEVLVSYAKYMVEYGESLRKQRGLTIYDPKRTSMAEKEEKKSLFDGFMHPSEKTGVHDEIIERHKADTKQHVEDRFNDVIEDKNLTEAQKEQWAKLKDQFMHNTYSVEEKNYVENKRDGTDFRKDVDQKLEDFIKINNPNVGVFSWEFKK